MAAENAEKKQPETTESYRGEIRNVERVLTPANDNRPGKTATGDNKQSRAAANDNLPATSRARIGSRFTKAPIGAAAVAETLQKGMAVAKAVDVTWKIVYVSALLYPIQLGFWIFGLVGLLSLVALEESWAAYLDVFSLGRTVAEAMFFLSLVVIFFIGILTLLGAMFAYTARQVEMTRGISIILAAICLALYAAPIINLVPWIWLWCLYVVKTQTDG